VTNQAGSDGGYTPHPNYSPISGVSGAAGAAAAGGFAGWFGKLLTGLIGHGSMESVSSSINYEAIPFMADGGPVDPGRPYFVGEAGMELFTPRTAGTITPAGKLGGDVHYNVDARGADLGVMNRVNRGLEAVHSSSVATSIRANADRSHRVPRRSN
jgi:hypothetical protein